jgi:rhamnosyl/mannosyltransferase
VPFGVESAPFEDGDGERARRMRARHGRYFVFVGRLVYYKGLDVLLDAMTDEPFRLVVAGGGPLRASWEGTLQRRGLDDRIEFLGECDDAELSDWILGSVGLILPSTLPSESFGIVQLEAMAAGRPVIVARASGGVASVQEDGVTALLVPPGDARALSESMGRLWEDPALADALGAAARVRFESHYTAERMVEGVEAVLEKSADVEKVP